MTCKGCELIKECRETGAELQTCKRYKPKTNFDSITDSPEALAGFIKTVIDVCYACDSEEYPKCTVCWCNPIALKGWLNKESKE